MGTGSALRLVLLLYKKAHVIAVDWVCREKIVELVKAALPAEYWEFCKDRFHYECMDFKTVTLGQLDAVCLKRMNLKFDAVLF